MSWIKAPAISAGRAAWSAGRGALILLLLSANVYAQNPRPSLGPLVAPANFERALKRGTRTTRGIPGPKYWINFASYRISARIDPQAKRLDGSTEINYRNFSPDTLRTLQLDLTLNIHRPDAERHETMEPTKGVEMKSVRVQGATAQTEVQGTRLIITPASPLLPGQSTTIAIEYGFEMPQAGAGERMGYSQDNLLFLAYWYPQMAVYDDIVGWHPDQFTGTSEFYADFGNYDYTVDVPAGWLIVGTGNLINAQQVLSTDAYQRLQRAESSDDVVHVIDAGNMASATAAGTNGRLRWHFIAENVRDVAFSVTRNSNWDALRAPVGDRNGDGQTDYTRVDAVWRNLAPGWSNAARMAAHAISFHSRHTGLPYPYPHMSAVEGAGIMNGGMEYPMMTLIGPYTGQPAAALYSVITHELAHMWYPMIISTDERRYSWMDEGTTQFNENEAERDYAHANDARFQLEDQETYLTVARQYEEGEIMRRSAYHYDPIAFEIATYEKPAVVLAALRAILGDSVFYKAYREFGNRWKYKHPYPWDMWNTFEDVSGRDLDWFWQQWYFTTWKLDQAVGAVTNTPAGALVRVDDLGGVAMPVLLTVTREGGEVAQRMIPVEVWLSGATSTTVTIPGGKVVRVEIDAARSFPDVNRTNNVWAQR